MYIFENTKLNKIDFFYIFVFFIFKRLKWSYFYKLLHYEFIKSSNHRPKWVYLITCIYIYDPLQFIYHILDNFSSQLSC